MNCRRGVPAKGGPHEVRALTMSPQWIFSGSGVAQKLELTPDGPLKVLNVPSQTHTHPSTSSTTSCSILGPGINCNQTTAQFPLQA